MASFYFVPIKKESEGIENLWRQFHALSFYDCDCAPDEPNCRYCNRQTEIQKEIETLRAL